MDLKHFTFKKQKKKCQANKNSDQMFENKKFKEKPQYIMKATETTEKAN